MSGNESPDQDREVEAADVGIELLLGIVDALLGKS